MGGDNYNNDQHDFEHNYIGEQMAVHTTETWYYWLVPINLSGIPGQKSASQEVRVIGPNNTFEITITDLDTLLQPGSQVVTVIAATRVVTIMLPPVSQDAGVVITVNRDTSSSYDVHVVPDTGDSIDGIIAEEEILTAASPTWQGVGA